MGAVTYLQPHVYAVIFTEIPRRRANAEYGDKLPTHRMIQLRRNGRWYRVYATRYGNAASQWITIGGIRHYLQECHA